MTGAAIGQVVTKLAAEGIDVTAIERDGIVYANVHAMREPWPATWLRVFTTFQAHRYCVKVNPPPSCG